MVPVIHPDQSMPRVLVQLGGIPLWGQERANIQVFTALRDAGVDSLFVTHKEYGHEVIQPALDRLGHQWTTGMYPRLIGRGMSSREWAQRMKEVWLQNRDFFRAGRRYQPTHLHACNEGQFLTSLPAILALRVPVIFRLGDEPRQHRPIFRHVWRRLIIPSVSQFVCVSEFIRGKLLAAGAPPERVRVIYTYPQERVPLAAGERLGGSAGTTRGSDNLRVAAAEAFTGRTFAFMGQLNELKGVHHLVRAAMKLCGERDDVRFLIAGDYAWQNQFAKDLIAAVNTAGLSDRIRFLGFVEDVEQLLALSDVHVCPSVWDEPLSNTVVEAKRGGIPSIVYNSGGLPELIRHGVDGMVVNEKSIEGLYLALSRAADLPYEKLAGMKHSARSSLERLGITRERFIRAWSEVYASV
jgi:glycosyltransferase involved in cell wall biosynthesis